MAKQGVSTCLYEAEVGVYAAVKQGGAMDDQHARIYLGEIVHQAEFAQMACRDLDNALSSREPTEMTRVWASTQSILAAAAMISKLLWPSPPSKKRDCSPLDEPDRLRREFTLDRGRDLRRRLELRESSILQKRNVRNAFEHFDERLDGHLAAGNWCVMDRIIAPRDVMLINDPTVKTLRRLDPQIPTASVLDDEVDLRALWEAIRDIHRRAVQALQQIDPWAQSVYRPVD